MKIMVVDASIICHQVTNTPMARFAIQEGPYKGTNTGLRYGFIRSIRSYADRLSADKVVICWDSAKVFKAEARKEYKANRSTSAQKQKMWEQMPGLKELVTMTCWTQAFKEGYEADDVIAGFSRKFGSSEEGHQVMIVTSDNDMSQLINDNVIVFTPGKKATVRNKTSVIAEWGIPPQMLPYYRAMEGDSSDNLAGAVSSGVLNKKHVLLSYMTILNSVPLDRKATWNEIRAVVIPRTENWIKGLGGVDYQAKNDLIVKFNANVDIMLLNPPEDVDLIKGTRDVKAMTELFERLEFKSLMDKIPELTGQGKP